MSTALALGERPVVLITGAASGLGAAGARAWLERGARVALLDIDGPGLAHQAQALASLSPEPILTLCGDITSLADCERAVNTVLQHYGQLDLVWANAGLATLGTLAHTDPVAWQRCIEVNVMGTFNTVRAALPALQARQGYVGLTASLASLTHPPLMSAYAAAKSALEAMADAWRIELEPHGVGVGVVYASWVQTPMVDEGRLHPSFGLLRDCSPKALQHIMPAHEAAQRIVDGMQRRRRRIWVPGWVRWLYALRSLWHLRLLETPLRRAAVALEQSYLDTVRQQGAAASSFPPRAWQREQARRQPPD